MLLGTNGIVEVCYIRTYSVLHGQGATNGSSALPFSRNSLKHSTSVSPSIHTCGNENRSRSPVSYLLLAQCHLPLAKRL